MVVQAKTKEASAGQQPAHPIDEKYRWARIIVSGRKARIGCGRG